MREDRGGLPRGSALGASSSSSTTTSIDEEWAATTASSSADDASPRAPGPASASARVDDDGASSSSSSGVASSAGTARSSASPAGALSCKKCAKGSSCWPVHVATQKLVSLRKRALRRACDPEEPWEQFESLLADGHRPTFKTYTALACVLGDAGAPEDAEDALARMIDAGEVPDARAYNAAAHAWARRDRPEEATRVVHRMRAAGVDPTESTYPEIVAAWARLGDEREIEKIISGIESDAGAHKPSGLGNAESLVWYERVYHAFIAGCLSANAPEGAEAVLRRWNLEKYDMERVADRKGDISRPVAASYGMVVDWYVREGRMGDARRLLSQMQWDKVAPSIDIFNMLLKGYLRSGNVGAAQDVFRELEGSGTWDMDSLGIEPDVASYTCLMDHWANQGDVELAEKVLKKMEARGVAPDERAFGSLVKAYQRARDPEGAEAVLERVRSYDAPQARDPAKYVGPKDERKKMKPNAVLFTTVISAYAAVGDMTNARRVLREMASKPRSWNAKPNERTFAHLSWGYAQLGDVAGITRVAQLMADAGVSLRRGTEGRAALARAFRECGLPTSHADALVEGLAPTPKKPARRKYERNDGEGERRRARAGGAKKKNEPEVSAETKKQNPAEVGTRRPSAEAKANAPPPRPGPSRSGDAGWVCAIEAPAGASRGARRGAIGAGGRRSVGARRTGMFRGVAFLRGGAAFAFAPRAGTFA